MAHSEVNKEVQAIGLEDIFMFRGSQILKLILQMVPDLDGIFLTNLSYPDQRHMISNLGVFVAKKKQRPRSLLKILLNLVNRATQKWD